MKKKSIFYFVSLILIFALGGYASADEVAQGKCISYDMEKKTLTLDEYDLNFSQEFKYGHPTGKQAVYDLASAKIGILPAVGDILRIAYQIKGDQRIASKLMNVTKQDLTKK